MSNSRVYVSSLQIQERNWRHWHLLSGFTFRQRLVNRKAVGAEYTQHMMGPIHIHTYRRVHAFATTIEVTESMSPEPPVPYLLFQSFSALSNGKRVIDTIVKLCKLIVRSAWWKTWSTTEGTDTEWAYTNISLLSPGPTRWRLWRRFVFIWLFLQSNHFLFSIVACHCLVTFLFFAFAADPFTAETNKQAHTMAGKKDRQLFSSSFL